MPDASKIIRLNAFRVKAHSGRWTWWVGEWGVLTVVVIVLLPGELVHFGRFNVSISVSLLHDDRFFNYKKYQDINVKIQHKVGGGGGVTETKI